MAKACAKTGGKAKSKAKSKAISKMCFAGRRPPGCPSKRATFDELRAVYLSTRPGGVHAGEEPSATRRRVPKTTRAPSKTQVANWKVMQAEMKKLAASGTPGPKRMRLAAAAWKATLNEV